MSCNVIQVRGHVTLAVHGLTNKLSRPPKVGRLERIVR